MWVRKKSAPRRQLRPRLELLEDRLTPAHMTYHGGALISHVVIEPIFYGLAWENGLVPNTSTTLESFAGRITKFLEYIVESPYMDGLGQYVRSPRGTIAESTSLTGFIPKEDFVDTSVGDVVSKGQLENLIVSQLNTGRVDPPAPNHLYFVFLPPGVELDDGTYAGFHSTFEGNYYAAIAFPGPVKHPDGRVTMNGFDGGNAFNTITITSSHEIVEAITNPECGGSGSVTGYIGQPGQSTKNQTPNSLREAFQETMGFKGGWYDESGISFRGELDKATTKFGRIVQPAYVNLTANNQGEVADLSANALEAEGEGDYGTFGPYVVSYYFHNTYSPEIPNFDGTTSPSQSDVNAIPPDQVGFSLDGSPLNAVLAVSNVFAPHEGTFSGVIGTFYDGRPQAGGNYTATIDWGDGTNSNGAVRLNSATRLYEVSGKHAYTRAAGTSVRVAIDVTAADGAASRKSSTVQLLAYAPHVSRVVGLVHRGKMFDSITVSFDSPLDFTTAGNSSLYNVLGGVTKRNRTTFNKRLKIKTVSVDNSNQVTIRLAKPYKGTLELIVHGGIKSAGGAISQGDVKYIIKLSTSTTPK